MSNVKPTQLIDQTGISPSLNTGATGFSTVPAGIPANRAPTSADLAPQFTFWDHVSAGTVWMQTAKGMGASWSALGTGAVGGIVTITGDSGGAESPDGGGNFNLLGTADQITVAGTANTETFSFPAAIITPGSLTTTTTLDVGTDATVGGTLDVTGLTTLAALTQIGTTNINASGAGVTTIGTGGTGVTNIGNATGNTAVTGSLTASTTLTATLGAITATNGNLVLGTAGNKIVSTSVASNTTAGANSFGTVTLVGGTATISTTAVTASSIIMLTRQSVGATGANDLGILSVGTIVAATSFVINAWTVTDATALQADDVSVIGWMIIN